MSVWAEAKTADGRVYYWHKDTKETRWDKPEDLDAAPVKDQAALDAAWNETTAPDGRKYYYNGITRETVWNAPEAFSRAQAAKSQAPAFVAGGGAAYGGEQDGFNDRRVARRDDRPRENGLPHKSGFERGTNGGSNVPWENKLDGAGFRGAMPAKNDEPDFATLDQAEDAFFKLLKKHNIKPDTDWTEALHLVIRERDFRALKDPKDRRAAFDKYRQQVREQEKIRDKERREKRREEFRDMLSTHPEIKHYSRWSSIKPIIEREAAYKSVGDEEESKAMSREYVIELARRHQDEEASKYSAAVQELDELLRGLLVDPDTKWSEAHEKITNSVRFTSDSTFRALDDVDLLGAYEKHLKGLDRAANDAKQKEKRLRLRSSRKARDDFHQLLRELRDQKKITAGTKWKQIHPLLAEDPRYLALLGQPGSTPLELFWDMLENEESKLRSKRNLALDVLEERRYEMTLTTQQEEFSQLMRSDSRTASYTAEEIGLIYLRLMDKIKKRAEERSEKSERHLKRNIDNLRSAIKHLDPPVRLNDTYEDVESRIRDFEEYKILEDSDRRRAFAKFMDRLKEKEEEYERDRARREARRDERDRERERDRDRRHRTRTPEIDAYEADRRKAQAERERHYRKASFGLTPPPRDGRDARDSRDRDRDPRERDPRDSRRDERDVRRRDYDSVYERERRERELERERNYVSRADPRDKGRTLDYGDDEVASGASRPGSSVRKRRESEGSEITHRDQKRARRATKTPEPSEVEAAKQEEVALQSGSEEGEIEEVP